MRSSIAAIALILCCLAGWARADIFWVGNVSPSVTTDFQSDIAVPLTISTEVYVVGVTPNAPAGVISCALIYSQVQSYGKPWVLNPPSPQMSFTGTKGNNDVFSCTLTGLALGFYEFTAYCTNTVNSPSRLYQPLTNGRFEVVPTGTLAYKIRAPSLNVFTGDKIAVFWNAPANHNSQDMITLRTFPYDANNACPTPLTQYFRNPTAGQSSGVVYIDVPITSQPNVLVHYYQRYNSSTIFTIQCAGAHYYIIRTLTFTIYDGSGPQIGGPGQALHFGYSLAFPEELTYKQKFLKKDFSLLASDQASYSLDVCSSSTAYSFSQFTIEAWFKSSPFTGCCSTIFYADDNLELQVIDNAVLRLTFFASSNPAVSTPTSTTLLDGSWHHVAAIVSRNFTTFLIDGSIVHSASISNPQTFSGKTFSIGSGKGFPRDKTDKWLEEFRLWSVARDVGSIQDSMFRSLRPKDYSPDLIAYYDFNPDPYQSPFTVLDRSGNGAHLQLGYEDIGSSGDQIFGRIAPKFVASSVALFESPYYVTFGKPFGTTVPNSVTVTLPYQASDTITRVTITKLPDSSITLRTLDGTAIVLGNSGFFDLPSDKLIVSMASASTNPLETSFTYQVSTATSTSGLGEVRIKLAEQLPPTPGGPGSALQCDGTQFGFAENFSLKLDPTTSATQNYTVEFWAFNYYSTVSERKGFLYSIGNTEVVGNWCGNEIHCAGRVGLAFGDPVIDAYNGWDFANDRGTAATDASRLWGEWTHYAVTAGGSGGKLTLYVNGEQQGQKDDTGAITDLNGLYLCHWPYYGPGVNAFVGLVDEFRIWNYIKATSEIKSQMNYRLSGTEPGLMVYYNFDEAPAGSSVTRAVDHSGNGHDLIFGGCTQCPTGKVCDANVTPRVPCYYTSTSTSKVDSTRSPTLVTSYAPVGGYLPSQQFYQGDTITLTLSSASPSGQVVEYVLSENVTHGTFTDSNGNVLSLSAGSTIPSPLNLIPGPKRGGNPFATISYQVKDNSFVSPQIVSLAVAVLCPAGTYTDQQNRLCVPCKAGTFSASPSNNASCQACPTNTYQSQTGQTNCTACLKGFYQNGKDPSRCSPCSSANYDPALGCPAAPPADLTASFGNGGSIALIVIACILIVISIFVILVFIVYQETPVIKAASPTFCFLILIGLIVGSSSTFVFVGAPTPASCILRPWIVALALALILGNLFIKTWRIYRIFGDTKYSSRMTLIGNRSLLLFSAGMVLAECLFPIIWTSVSPLKPTYYEVGSVSYIDCASESPTVQWVMIGLMIAVNLGGLIYGAYLAFQTRKVSSAFKESKYIAACIYNIIFTSVVVLAISYIESTGYYTVFYIRVIGALFCCAFILVSLFGPKLYIIFLEPEKNTASYMRTFRNEGGRKMSSFSAPETNTTDSSSRDSDNMSGTILMRDDSDKFTTVFTRAKWTPRHCFLFRHERSFAWSDGTARGDSGFFFLKGASATSIEINGEFEIEVLIEEEDITLRMKFEKKDDFEKWSMAFKSVCKFRRFHVKGDSMSSQEPLQKKGSQAGSMGLVKAASQISIGLDAIESN